MKTASPKDPIVIGPGKVLEETAAQKIKRKQAEQKQGFLEMLWRAVFGQGKDRLTRAARGGGGSRQRKNRTPGQREMSKVQAAKHRAKRRRRAKNKAASRQRKLQAWKRLGKAG